MKKFLSFLLFLFPVSLSFATPFEHNGVYYEVISESTVSVVKASYVSGWYTHYQGDIEIPSSIIYNDVEYTVTEIGNQVFRGQSKLKNISIPSSVKIGRAHV